MNSRRFPLNGVPPRSPPKADSGIEKSQTLAADATPIADSPLSVLWAPERRAEAASPPVPGKSVGAFRERPPAPVAARTARAEHAGRAARPGPRAPPAAASSRRRRADSRPSPSARPPRAADQPRRRAYPRRDGSRMPCHAAQEASHRRASHHAGYRASPCPSGRAARGQAPWASSRRARAAAWRDSRVCNPGR